MEIGPFGEFRDNANEYGALRIHDYSAKRSELEAAIVLTALGGTPEKQTRRQGPNEVQHKFPIPGRIVGFSFGYFAIGKPSGERAGDAVVRGWTGRRRDEQQPVANADRIARHP